MRSDDEDLALVISRADHFVSIAFRGRGKYDRIDSPTLDAAREAAKRLYVNRLVAIYVVAFNLEGAVIRSRHVENWPT